MNATIKIYRSILEELKRHCLEVPSYECGGYLFGYYDMSDENILVDVKAIYHEKRIGDKASFTFSPLYEYNAKLYSQMCVPQFRLLGCYHSHGEYPAIFSDDDRVLQAYWIGKHCTLVYSPGENRIVGDIITGQGEAIPARITVYGNLESSFVELPKKPMKQKILLPSRKH